MSELVEMLQANRFVALLGASASGKTSLIQSGLIPALLSDINKEWIPVSIRPGDRPMLSLIRGFQQVFPQKISDTEVNTFLNDTQNIGRFIIGKKLGNYRYFLVVDQFEELFTVPAAIRKKKKNGKNPETRQFIENLISAVEETESEIFVMLSIRADFLDLCTSYRLLTDQINKSKYLLPQMSRESLQEAIKEPIHQSGASIAPGLEQYLLDQLEEVTPQLPFLQYALHHTWNHWVEREEPDQPVSLEDLHAAGTLDGFWNRELEDPYNALEFRQKKICERMFKCIAFRTDNQEYIGWYSSIEKIAKIAQCSVQEAIEIVQIFSSTGGPILGPHSTAPLSSKSNVELSHECLITLWDRLKRWVDEEADSISMYLRLSEAAFNYQQGRVELWKPPDLQEAVAWRDLQNPNAAWGTQFDPAFERTLVFLSTSEEEYATNEERKVIKLRRRRLMIRFGATFLAVTAVMVLLIFLLSKSQPDILRQSDNYLNQNSGEPVLPIPEANVPEMTTIQPFGEQEAENLPNEFSGSEIEEEVGGPVTVQNEITDDTSQQQAGDEFRDDSAPNETLAIYNQENAPGNSIADNIGNNLAGAYGPVELNIVRDVAEQSLEVLRNPDLQGLLAYQAYKMNVSYGGDPNDPSVYQGLYEALKQLIAPNYNIYGNLRNSITAMEWLDRSGSILITSSDGSIRILSGTLADRSAQINLEGTGLNNECLAVSPDEKIAAVGTNGGGLFFIELENKGNVIHHNTERGESVLFIQNLGTTGSFLSAGTGNRILKWNYNDFSSSTLVIAPDRPTALVASGNGSSVMLGTRNGKLYTINTGSPSQLTEVNNFGANPLRALAFSPDERYLATGHLDGTVRILSGDGRTVFARLYGPGARVSALEFSPNGKFLVAASHDGNVYMWNMQNLDSPPLLFTENNGFVLSICFNRNSSFFYTGSVSYPRMVGRPTEPESMARDFCSLLGRNLTREEWIRYFGESIPYEETCPR